MSGFSWAAEQIKRSCQQVSPHSENPRLAPRSAHTWWGWGCKYSWIECQDGLTVYFSKLMFNFVHTCCWKLAKDGCLWPELCTNCLVLNILNYHSHSLKWQRFKNACAQIATKIHHECMKLNASDFPFFPLSCWCLNCSMREKKHCSTQCSQTVMKRRGDKEEQGVSVYSMVQQSRPFINTVRNLFFYLSAC